MRARKPVLARLALAALIGLAAQGALAGDSAVRRFITIGTGGPAGVYHAAGRGICGAVEEAAEARAPVTGLRLRCMAPPTGGSRFNISRLALGALDFALAQSDWQHHAYHGTASERIKPFPGLRSVFALHAEPLQLIVASGSGIRGFRDLAGRRVNVGNAGSGHRGTLEILLGAYGMAIGDFALATEFTTTEDARALCEGEIDAFVTATGLNAPHVAVATDGCGARILPLDTAVERRLVAATPHYAFVTIPKGTYRSSVDDVVTFGPVATLVTRAQVGDEAVYELVRAVMENLDRLRSAHPALAGLSPPSMVREGLSAPLHPGALRYYRERGWR